MDVFCKGGNMQQQEKNNLDNFKTISEYHRRFAKLNLQPPSKAAGHPGRLKRGL